MGTAMLLILVENEQILLKVLLWMMGCSCFLPVFDQRIDHNRI